MVNRMYVFIIHQFEDTDTDTITLTFKVIQDQRSWLQMEEHTQVPNYEYLCLCVSPILFQRYLQLYASMLLCIWDRQGQGLDVDLKYILIQEL